MPGGGGAGIDVLPSEWSMAASRQTRDGTMVR